MEDIFLSPPPQFHLASNKYGNKKTLKMNLWLLFKQDSLNLNCYLSIKLLTEYLFIWTNPEPTKPSLVEILFNKLWSVDRSVLPFNTFTHTVTVQTCLFIVGFFSKWFLWKLIQFNGKTVEPFQNNNCSRVNDCEILYYSLFLFTFAVQHYRKLWKKEPTPCHTHVHFIFI